jgi:putative glutamine amidotransferase
LAAMTKPPLILVSPDIEAQGVEFKDLSISLSLNYQRALLEAGALPLVLPATTSGEMLGEAVRRADGVMLTGGEDVDPQLSAPKAPQKLKALAKVTPDGGARDLREFMVIEEVFRQRKPLLAICRGHQVLNVALGGTLILDIPAQKPGALRHRCPEKKSDIAHEVRLTAGSRLHKITGAQVLGVNSTHHQAVGRVAGLLRVAAQSRDGVVEGLELDAKHAGRLPFMLSVQFHPERLADRYPEHRAIFAAFVQACATNRVSAL